MNLIVIKYGGSLLEEPGHRSAFLKDVATLAKQAKVVLVHGGGKEITREMEKRGLEARFVDGKRYTDEKTMEVVREVLSNLNRSIVKELRSLGAEAFRCSGEANRVVVARANAALGRVGDPEQVDPQALAALLSEKGILVFFSVAVDGEGAPLNINADDFALTLAVAAKAARLVFLTDTGAIRDGQGKDIATITESDVERLVKEGVITGGMMVKARACVDALRRGVGRVDITKGIEALLDPKAPMAGTSFVRS